MKIERLFQVLVVTGASSTVGIIGCGSDTGGGTTGSGGSTGTGGSTSSSTGGGSSSTGGSTTGTGGGTSAATEASCAPKCHPSTAQASWIDCNGCCCWLPAGLTTKTGSPICGEEPCCAVGNNGR